MKHCKQQENIVEKKHSLRRVNKTWNFFFNSFFDYLNGKKKNSMGPRGVFKEEEDVEMIIKWMLAMQECGLYIY
jgi:hypothetical protein